MHATARARASAPPRPRARRLRRVHTRAASEAESSPADASPSVVLGANGRTGREIVRSLLRRGMPTRACTRSGTFDARELLGDDASGAVVPWTFPLLQPTAADVTRPETVASATRDARFVFFACTAPAKGDPDAVDRTGLIEVARACVDNNVSRLVVISGAGVTKTNSPAYGFLNAFGGRMDAKRRGETELREVYEGARSSGGTKGVKPTYTIVRPSGLLDGPGKGAAAMAVNQGDEAAGFIDRIDVAECAVESALSVNCANVSFEVYELGTAVPTRTLSIADILSDPLTRTVVSVVTGKAFRGGDGQAEREAREKALERERSGCSDWSTLLSGFEPSIYD